MIAIFYSGTKSLLRLKRHDGDALFLFPVIVPEKQLSAYFVPEKATISIFCGNKNYCIRKKGKNRTVLNLPQQLHFSLLLQPSPSAYMPSLFEQQHLHMMIPSSSQLRQLCALWCCCHPHSLFVSVHEHKQPKPSSSCPGKNIIQHCSQ
jgi:hypothetical protein